MYNFELVKPSTLQDAVAALKSEDAQALGGGQTLLPTMKARLAMTEQLVALSGIDEIKGICTDDDGRICIGGATTHTAVAEGATGYPARVHDLLETLAAMPGARLPGARRRAAIARARAEGIDVPVIYLEQARALAHGGATA